MRSLDHSQTLVALIEFPSREAAEAFAMSTERARTLKEAGVTSTTDEFLEILRPIVTTASA